MIVTLTNYNVADTIFTVFTYIDKLVKHELIICQFKKKHLQIHISKIFIIYVCNKDKQLISTEIRPTVQE